MAGKERKLYKIGYLTERLGVTPRTIRYYDQMGLLPHVKRSDGNVRLFDDEDLEIIKKIRKMQKEDYLPLEVIKDKLFGNKGNTTNDEIAIVTDSTAVVPENLKKELGINVLPLTIELKGKTYKEETTNNKKDFWKRLEKSEVKAKTTAPSVQEFVDFYVGLKNKGYKKIYSVHISSHLSKTCEHASIASDQVADRIEVVVVDSKSTGSGLGLFSVQLAERIHANESPQQLEVFISKQVPLIYYTSMVNDLKYLTYSTPDKNTEYPEIMEKLYQFKPIFTINENTGEIEIIDCVKTINEAKDLLIKHFENEWQLRGKYAKYIMISYNFLYSEAIELSNVIKTICPQTPVYVEEGCMALTAYLGPETLSISVA